MAPKTADGFTSSCWCCGMDKFEEQLLRLGARPGAAVCLDCVACLLARVGAGVVHQLVANVSAASRSNLV